MRQRCAECDCGDGPCNWIAPATYSAKIEREGDDYLLVFPPEVLRSLGAEVGDDVVWAIDSLGRVSVSKSTRILGDCDV